MQILNEREILLIALTLIAQQGLPWLMRIAFPAFMHDRDGRRKSEDMARMNEMQFKKEVAERELGLRQEIANREAIIEERNMKNLEALAQGMTRLTEVVGANTMQLNVVSATVGGMKAEQEKYFQEGRPAIAKIMRGSRVKKAR